MKRLILISVLFLSLISSAQKDELQLNNLIDNWHKAAGNADFKSYFGLMDTSFVFLGTAPGERWKKEEFAAFSKPYFDKGQAWDFTPSNRIWQFSKNRKIAWFDEDLQTWMEGCRGSGIMAKKGKEWKIVYYNLTVLIENEKIKEFIDLRKQ